MSPQLSRRAGQDGFLMVTVMIVLMITLIVAGVAISDTGNARSFTEGDRRADIAQQAADAGAQIALYRANQMNLGTADFNSGLNGLSSTLSCLVPGLDASGAVSVLTKVTLGAQSSCPTQPAGGGACTTCWSYERLGNRTTFAYQFLPGSSSNVGASSGHDSLNPVIVAIGREDGGTPSDASDDVVRRVEMILNPVDPFDMIEATGNLTFNDSLATTLNGDVRTNGNLSIGGLGLVGANVLGADGSVLRLANVQYGGSISGLLTVASRVHTSQPFTRAPVSISPSKPDCVAGTCPSSTFYNSATHKLTVGAGQSLTLGGGDFVFCGVSVASSGTLHTSTVAGSPTRIFVDSPTSTRCSGVPSSGNLSLLGGLNTVTTTPSQLQIYLAGNGTPGGTTAAIDTTVLGSVTPAFFLYAPDTNVTMGFFTFQGNIIGHDVTMTPGCLLKVPILGTCVPGLADVLTQDLNLYNLPLSSSVGVFSRKEYVQCAGSEPPAATPTKDC